MGSTRVHVNLNPQTGALDLDWKFRDAGSEQPGIRHRPQDLARSDSTGMRILTGRYFRERPLRLPAALDPISGAQSNPPRVGPALHRLPIGPARLTSRTRVRSKAASYFQGIGLQAFAHFAL